MTTDIINKYTEPYQENEERVGGMGRECYALIFCNSKSTDAYQETAV